MQFLMLVFLMFSIPNDMLIDQLVIEDEEKIIKTIHREELSYPILDLGFIDVEQMKVHYEKLREIVYKAPINAQIANNEQIIEGKTGYKLNASKFYDALQKFFYSGALHRLEIPKQVIHPRVTGELLADISVNKLGSFTTFYKKNNYERSHNINLATEAINNHVVFPGESFSFNEVVGERTVETGYKRAPVIVKGEIAEDIGGGICQVSSTLFNAVNLRGIQIVERYSHSREVPYVPPGKDATVSWWGPDFVFKNNYKEPILIRAIAQNGKLEIHIYSSSEIPLYNNS